MIAALVCFAVTACGSSRGATTQRNSKLVVLADSSLRGALPLLDRGNEYDFASSPTLVERIEGGATADAVVSDSPAYLDRLQREGLLYAPPAWFATNRLVLIVPRGNPARIRTVRDLARPLVRVALGAPGVPAGDSARKALADLHLLSVLKNVHAVTPDAAAVARKVAAGAVDAGFAYASDMAPVAKGVREIPLPRAGRETALYGAAALKHAADIQDARGFVALLLSPPGQAILSQNGFGPAPKQKRTP